MSDKCPKCGRAEGPCDQDSYLRELDYCKDRQIAALTARMKTWLRAWSFVPPEVKEHILEEVPELDRILAAKEGEHE